MPCSHSALTQLEAILLASPVDGTQPQDRALSATLSQSCPDLSYRAAEAHAPPAKAVQGQQGQHAQLAPRTLTSHVGLHHEACTEPDVLTSYQQSTADKLKSEACHQQTAHTRVLSLLQSGPSRHKAWTCTAWAISLCLYRSVFATQMWSSKRLGSRRVV